MKKFKFLTIHNLKKVVYTKGFLISNIIIFLLIVLMINLPNIISRFEAKTEEITAVVYYDNLTSENHNKIENYLTASLNEEALEAVAIDKLKFNLTFKTIVLDDENQDAIVTQFKESDLDVLIRFINTDDIDNLQAQIYYNTGSNKAKSALSSVIQQAKIVINQVNISLVDVQIFLPPGDEEFTEQMMISMNIINLIVSIPMLMIIVRALVFVGVDIVQEKSSKAIETIISSVPARTHFFAKVLASLGFVIIQSVLMLVFGFIGALIAGTKSSGEILNFIDISQGDLISFLLVTVAFTIVNSLFYLIVGGILSAMSNTQEDYQVFQGPLTLIMLVGFYLNMFLFGFGPVGISILKVASFIPPFSGFVAPFVFAIKAINWWEMLISFIIFTILLIITIYFFEPVYKVSILNYEQTKFFQRIASNFKKSRLERKAKK
ncbi:MAG: ABC transporter permease [Acholeplasmataceae bacterium]|jgi:ABC-2 type transport system permease protein